MRRYGSRMRHGVPLPGLTPRTGGIAARVRFLGPLHGDGARWVVAGSPAANLTDTARRRSCTVGMIKARTARVPAVGTTLPLTDRIVTAAMRGTRTG